MSTFVQRVVVPAHANHNLPNGAALPTTLDDTRRFVRRASDLQARLEIVTGWDLDNESERLFTVPVTNLSRSGACFLHHVQLFPDDQVILDFGSLRREFHVTRCRRLGNNCFEIGVRTTSIQGSGKSPG
jgi:hypothetical protein